MTKFEPNLLLQDLGIQIDNQKEISDISKVKSVSIFKNKNFLNKFMRKTIMFAFLMAFGFSAIAQDEDTYNSAREKFKKASEHLLEGDRLMNFIPAPLFNEALEHYIEAYKHNAQNAQLNFNMGLCYLNTTQKFKALEYFQKAYELDPKVSPEIQYFLGRGHHLKMEWDTALMHYNQYKKDKKIGSEMPADANMNVVKRIKECEVGKEMVASPQPYKIENMGKKINSPYSDYGMILTADASEIFFTSRRPSSDNEKIDDKKTNTESVEPDAIEGIYTTSRHDAGEWLPPKKINIPTQLKSHDAPVALNPDGSKMIIYIDDMGDGNLYESERDGDNWSEPKSFNDQINSPYHESSAWYSPDGKQLYFVSDRPVKLGDEPKDRDIFVATWDDTQNDWINIKRLPQTINSEYDEDGVYVHPDGKTLYFSSKGHNSMGGFDVFKTVRQSEDSWTTPENLGYPINTPDDDVFFTVAANGKDGYISSYREDGKGEKDLYLVTQVDKFEAPKTDEEEIATTDETETAVDEETKTAVSNLTILKGIVRDSKTQEPIRSDIELVDNGTGEVVATFASNSKSGRYLIILPGGKNYGISASAKNYLFYSDNFDLTGVEGYQEVELDIDLQKLAAEDIATEPGTETTTPSTTEEPTTENNTEISSSITLKNIFYDFNKYTLRDESKTELNRVVKFMKDYPEIRIKISSHTDTRGAEGYNQTLSENRAKSVVNYLISNGINKNRLVSQGLGEAQPVVSDSEINKLTGEEAIEAAHQKNRRTEFGILSK